MPRAELSLPAVPGSVRAARHFVATTLAAWQAADLGWAATQVVSELATNALLHARTPFEVQLDLTGTVLRLTVADGSAATLRPRRYAATATTGRGLSLVSELARDWGTESRPEGKAVWCELDVPTGGGQLAGDSDGDRARPPGPAVSPADASRPSRYRVGREPGARLPHELRPAA